MKKTKILTIAAIALLLTSVIPFSKAYSFQPKGEIVSYGQTETTVIPDTAIITLGIVTKNKDAKTAADLNAEKMNKIITAVKACLEKNETVKTSSYQLRPEYEYSNNKSTQTGFSVTNTITIKIKNVAKVGNVIDKAISNGANSVNNVDFSFANTDCICKQLVTEASKEALDNAKNLATSLNVKVGKIKSVSYSCSNDFTPNMMYKSNFAGMGDSMTTSSSPIEAGEIKINASVNATFYTK